MPLAQKFVGGLVLIGLVTTAILPNRKTVDVINAINKLVTQSFGTVMATK